MTILEYTKQYSANFDWFLVLLKDLGFTDDEIMTKFIVSKQRIYGARKRLEPILSVLPTISARKDMRDPDVQTIIEAFQTAFGTTNVTKYDRWSAKRLHAKYGAANVIKVINALAPLTGEKFAPVVNSVQELETKLVSVSKFLNTKSNEITIDL